MASASDLTETALQMSATRFSFCYMRLVSPSLRQMHLNLAEYAGVSGIESANPFALSYPCFAWESLVGIVSLSSGVFCVAVVLGECRAMCIYVMCCLLLIDLHQ